MFGDALAADGTEDAEIVVASPAEQPELAARPGNRVIAQNGGIFADALRLGPSASR